VRLLDSGSDEALRTPFMVMELLQGMDLSLSTEKIGAMDPKAVAKLGVQVCRGLQAVHQQQLVHRDIKPANIFLSRQGKEIVVKICDFGIAKHTGLDVQDETAALTATGSLLGTPVYSAPEQAMNPRGVDGRADIWSLCLSLYKALCARRIWPRVDTVPQLYLWICTQDVRPLLQVAPWIDAELAEIIHRGLQREPDQRWADVKQLEVALLEWLGTDATIGAGEVRPVDPDRREAALSIAPEVEEEEVNSSLVFSAMERSGDAPTHQLTAAPAPKKWGLAAGIVALASAAVAFATMNRQTVTATDSSLATSTGSAVASESPPTPANPASASASVQRIEARVRIEPPQSKVTVGGTPQSVAGGVLILNGQPGDSFDVVVQYGATKLERAIVLLRDGTASPAELKIPRRTATQPRPAIVLPKPSTKPAAPPAPAASAWKLRDDWSD
jgi:serine/threonine-protein kinase